MAITWTPSQMAFLLRWRSSCRRFRCIFVVHRPWGALASSSINSCGTLMPGTFSVIYFGHSGRGEQDNSRQDLDRKLAGVSHELGELFQIIDSLGLKEFGSGFNFLFEFDQLRFSGSASVVTMAPAQNCMAPSSSLPPESFPVSICRIVRSSGTESRS